MKAIVYHTYGTPDVLELKEVSLPVPGDNEILIKVHAVSLNSSDWEFLRGKPVYTRMWGLRKPKYTILGSDVAGRVERMGKHVTQFKVGDEVLGDTFGRWGGLAEYVCADEHTCVLKPANMSFEEAAAIPQAGVVALQGLRDKGQIQHGQKVLINGAGGGAGTFALQMARMYGTEVTGVDSNKKLEMMRTLGADHVIDYVQEDFTRNGKRYDLILDLVARRSMVRCKRALAPAGNYVMVGGSMAALLQAALLGPIISMTGTQKLGILEHKQNKKDLNTMLELFERGKVIPVIDKQFALDEAAEAFRYLGEGHALGKVVIKM